jgi:hypothetical protein
MSDEINVTFVDRFTLWHGALGLALSTSRMSLPTVLLLGAVWEVVERPLKDRYPAFFPHSSQDTFINAIGDVAGVMVGYAIGRAIRLC